MTALLAFVELFALVVVTVAGRFLLMAVVFATLALPVVAGATLCSSLQRKPHAAV